MSAAGSATGIVSRRVPLGEGILNFAQKLVADQSVADFQGPRGANRVRAAVALDHHAFEAKQNAAVDTPGSILFASERNACRASK